ncbi:McbB family protein [Pseudomonas gingeri]|uniref:McbB family protein n=1 Tax=Pseudomonas gingeri TaxID=117681 RepID=UPI0015A23250|nr:McbB family protein [Pseudomonas gingeri]NWA03850.1 McbB family protein [Pseudomonas gingeri]NWA12746.1 McbB family protein [Pseudomonas gingeri]NWA58837.1 McbB family protein [Pseudomonas gingeri]NWA94397.1 McbB family protein [Pseudomonas gingeri]NWB01053.1 McbB family protein [Pseudomonas gingeri]
MNISIQNYEILNFPNEDLIVSERGISKISSLSLLNALKTIKNRNQKNISKEEINEILIENDLDPEAAFSFLEKTLNIKKPISDYFFKKIAIIHDFQESELEKTLATELYLPVDFHHFPSPTSKIKNKNRKFFFILLNSYDYASLKKLYFEIASNAPQSAISVGSMIGNSFYISPPYIPEIGNPCHFCNVDRLESNDQSSQRENNWIKLLKFFKGRNSPIPPSQHTLLQRSMILGAIANHINFYTTPGNEKRHQDSIFLTSHIDIHKGLITEENLSHWFMCDCLRSKT